MTLRNWLVIAAMGLLAACTTVRSSAAPGANLARYRTFGFIEPTDPAAAQMQRTPAGQTIRNEIARNLYARGMTEANQGHPDFLVAYRVVYQPMMDVWGPGWGWDWGWGWGSNAYTYIEGTIIVDFVDPQTHEVIWRGTATRDVDHPENPDLGTVASSVDKLMKKYPVRVAAAPAPPTG